MELKLICHELLTSKLSANYCCDSSADGKFHIIAEAGMFVFRLKGDPTNKFNLLSGQLKFWETPDYIPCENLDIDLETFLADLPRLALYETVCQAELSPNIQVANKVLLNIINAQWSPLNHLNGNACALAILNNMYCLEIFVEEMGLDEITKPGLVVNITKFLIDHVKKNWKSTDKLMVGQKLTELKKRMHDVSVTGFCWGPMFTLNQKQYSLLWVGNMSGTLSVFQIGEITTEYTFVKLLGRYQSKLGHITAMNWEQTNDFEGQLLFGDNNGSVNLLYVTKLNENQPTFKEELPIWLEKDKLVVDKLLRFAFESISFILIAKQNYLIINAIKDNGQVLDRTIMEFSSFYICGLNYIGNSELLLLSFTGTFQKIKIIIRYDKIHVEQQNINLPIDLKTQRLHGLIVSENQAFFIILSSPCRSQDISRGKSFINLYIFQNTAVDPFTIIWNSTSESLRSYWDCFEVLRLLTIRDRKFAWETTDMHLNFDTLSLKQLKIIRILSKIADTLRQLVLTIDKNSMEKPFIVFHYLVDIKLAMNRINKLLTMRNNGATLSLFQMQSIDIQVFFLKEMVMQEVLPKGNVGNNFIDEMYHVISLANELRYPGMPQCFWCGEKILGPSCIPPHVDSRCAISMMPMGMVPGFKCPFCQCLVHKEIENELDELICPYCDVPLDTKHSPSNPPKLDFDNEKCDKFYSALFNNSMPEEVKSDCKPDCFKSDDAELDIEDNNVEVALLSDSDGEEIEDLKDIYDNLKTLTI